MEQQVAALQGAVRGAVLAKQAAVDEVTAQLQSLEAALSTSNHKLAEANTQLRDAVAGKAAMESQVGDQAQKTQLLEEALEDVANQLAAVKTDQHNAADAPHGLGSINKAHSAPPSTPELNSVDQPLSLRDHPTLKAESADLASPRVVSRCRSENNLCSPRGGNLELQRSTESLEKVLSWRDQLEGAFDQAQAKAETGGDTAVEGIGSMPSKSADNSPIRPTTVYECEKDCGFKDPSISVVEAHEALCGAESVGELNQTSPPNLSTLDVSVTTPREAVSGDDLKPVQEGTGQHIEELEHEMSDVVSFFLTVWISQSQKAGMQRGIKCWKEGLNMYLEDPLASVSPSGSPIFHRSL